MYPLQQTTGQNQGAQYLNFGSFNLAFTGGGIQGVTGYLCGNLKINGFAPNTSTQIEFTLINPEKDPLPVNDATVTLTIKDCDGNELNGMSWPQEIPYSVDSDGVYVKTFSPFPNQVLEKLYSFTISAVGSDGLRYECPELKRSEYCRC